MFARMNRPLTRSLLGLTAIALVGVLMAPLSVSADHHGSKGDDKKMKDIVDTAAGNKDFSTLVAAIKAAGLVDALKDKGPFTVFAPTNEAFAKLPEGTLENLLKPENRDQLKAVLTYHVVPGRHPAAQVVKSNNKELTTLQGGKVKITVRDDGTVMVNDAKVTATDVKATNGVIHVIDSVILPPSN